MAIQATTGRIVATFSDGTVKRYTGKRPVTVAWAIFVDGEIAGSGVSLDYQRAVYTSSGSIPMPEGIYRPERPSRDAVIATDQRKAAKRHGFATFKEFQEDNSRRRTAWIAEHVRVEIVPIDQGAADE